MTHGDLPPGVRSTPGFPLEYRPGTHANPSLEGWVSLGGPGFDSRWPTSNFSEGTVYGTNPPTTGRVNMPYGSQGTVALESDNRPYRFILVPASTCRGPLIWSRIGIGCRNEIASLCSDVRKWNIRFDGKKDPVSFLERLQKLIDAYSVDPEDVLRVLPELLTSEALLWYRNVKDSQYGRL